MGGEGKRAYLWRLKEQVITLNQSEPEGVSVVPLLSSFAGIAEMVTPNPWLAGWMDLGVP